jgi:hypothetical protein
LARDNGILRRNSNAQSSFAPHPWACRVVSDRDTRVGDERRILEDWSYAGFAPSLVSASTHRVTLRPDSRAPRLEPSVLIPASPNVAQDPERRAALRTTHRGAGMSFAPLRRSRRKARRAALRTTYRGAGIRTRDLRLPKPTRYRTAPHPANLAAEGIREQPKTLRKPQRKVKPAAPPRYPSLGPACVRWWKLETGCFG